MTSLPVSKKRLVALVFAVLLVAAIALVAATSGLGKPGVPSDAVAVVDGVDDGEVSRDEYDRAMEQSAARLGLKEVPPPTDPQYEQLNDETMQGLLLAIWAEGEAADRGIEVTDDDVQAELDEIESSFRNEEEFARVVEQSKFCTEEEIANDVPPIECADVIEQGRLLALQRELSDAFAAAGEGEVSDADIEEFYEANIESFQTPATRSVRVILNEDEKQVEDAVAELGDTTPDDPDFAKTWKAVAKKYSQDQASKDRGGLLEGLVEGQGDPELDAEVFGAPVGELSEPFPTSRGTYVIQVVEETPASTQPLEEASPAIEQQLTSARQQAQQQAVQNEFIEKWQRRTECIEEVMMQFCDGFVPPEPEQIPGQPPQPEPAAVNSTSPIAPGTATISIDGNTTTGLPQGPKVPIPETPAATGTLPPGSVPIGPDGAPTGAPPTGAPPTGAPATP
jgi:foldase protein PrsA